MTNTNPTTSNIDADLFCASLTDADLLKVYSGRPGCMCGCRGKYTYNPLWLGEAGVTAAELEPSEMNKGSLTRVLRTVQRAAEDDEQVEIDLDAGNIYVDFGRRVYCLYLTKAAAARLASTHCVKEAARAAVAATADASDEAEVQKARETSEDAEGLVDEIEEKLEELAKLYRAYGDAVPNMRRRVEAYAISAVDALRGGSESSRHAQCTVDELRDEALQLWQPDQD